MIISSNSSEYPFFIETDHNMPHDIGISLSPMEIPSQEVISKQVIHRNKRRDGGQKAQLS
jgi:hypothetical protein